MFTGIVRDIGTIERAAAGALTIASVLAADAHLGDSIAINGVDLTVTARNEATFNADVMPETARRSTIDRLTHGTAVNLEPAVRPIDGLSGHLVRGVIEGVATIIAIEPDGDARILRCECQSDLTGHMVVKGPIALDGVSLTLIEVGNDNGTAMIRKRIRPGAANQRGRAASTIEQIVPGPTVNDVAGPISGNVVGK